MLDSIYHDIKITLTFLWHENFKLLSLLCNSLDQDHAKSFVEPDLGPNCLQGYHHTTLPGKEFMEDNAQFYPAVCLCNQMTNYSVVLYMFIDSFLLIRGAQWLSW